MEVKKNMCIECCCGTPRHERGHEHDRRFLTKAEKAEKHLATFQLVTSKIKKLNYNQIR